MVAFYLIHLIYPNKLDLRGPGGPRKTEDLGFHPASSVCVGILPEPIPMLLETL